MNIKKNNLLQRRALISFCPKCGNDLRSYQIPQNQIITPPNQIPENNISLPQPNNEIKVKESMLSKEEQKNNIILITGAILIVLSAIIFLLSTWGSTGNITKTIIILLMLVIFFLTSRISDKVFHLKQTSQVFYYIALSYIPIALFSISLFGLFGYYLSIFGSGKYIYFSLSSLLISIIYIYANQKHNTIFLIIIVS